MRAGIERTGEDPNSLGQPVVRGDMEEVAVRRVGEVRLFPPRRFPEVRKDSRGPAHVRVWLLGVPAADPRRIVAVNPRGVVEREGQLTEVVAATGCGCGSPDALDRAQQERRQERDDRDDDEEFEERNRGATVRRGRVSA